jgi:hypothetical protein
MIIAMPMMKAARMIPSEVFWSTSEEREAEARIDHGVDDRVDVEF